MLSQYRVIDLTNERGMFCGYLLAHLGAEVIAIEPPGGSSAHQLAPFDANGESLWWQAYTRGKEIRELDLTTEAGQAAFRELAADADFVIDSFSNAEREQLGLGYDALAAINPALISVSITPFGSSGPKAEWPATDLSVWASSGSHVLVGDADRAPVRPSVPQAWLHAGADATGAALIALQARHKDGLGQHVDVSAQVSSAQAALGAMLGKPNNSAHSTLRMAGGMNLVGLPVRLTWPCKDGYVTISLMFGPALEEPNRRLIRWLVETGHCEPEAVEFRWMLQEMAADPEPYLQLCQNIESFTLERTQADLCEEGVARGIFIAPMYTTEGLFDEEHFRERDYWHSIEIGNKQVRVPGAFAKLSASPLRLPGSAGSTAKRTNASAIAKRNREDGELPLAGLKVLDFTWSIAGPMLTRVLAEYGATVIKVESSKRTDPMRFAPHFRDDHQSVEHSAPFASFNAGKLSVTVDPNNPAGREVIRDLVSWADLLTESFSPKAMAAWGLDYNTLKEINPRLIMLSSCLMGQTGPRAQVPGYGNMAAAITGYYELTGWQDRSPAGPYIAYTDGVSPRFMLTSLLGALEHRHQTGEGQYIDLSQAEASIQLLAPALLDFELNGHIWTRDGNRDLQLCPHGVFPTRGDDCWIAIACQSDEAWTELARLAGLPQDDTLTTAAGRKGREDELERELSAWTSERDGAELEAALISAGIAVHVVQNSDECWADPQLAHRKHFVPVSHSTVGKLIVEGSRFSLSRTPAQVERAPRLGEHNDEVLFDILGYDADHAAEVVAAKAME